MSAIDPVKRPRVTDTEANLLKEEAAFLSRNKTQNHAETGDIPVVMHDIRENSVSLASFDNLLASFDGPPTGFPIVERTYSTTNLPTASTSQVNGCAKSLENSIRASSGVVLPDDRLKIHEENQQRMAQMSHEEIIEQREKILKSLDPALIKLVKQKGAMKTTVENDIKSLAFKETDSTRHNSDDHRSKIDSNQAGSESSSTCDIHFHGKSDEHLENSSYSDLFVMLKSAIQAQRLSATRQLHSKLRAVTELPCDLNMEQAVMTLCSCLADGCFEIVHRSLDCLHLLLSSIAREPLSFEQSIASCCGFVHVEASVESLNSFNYVVNNVRSLLIACTTILDSDSKAEIKEKVVSLIHVLCSNCAAFASLVAADIRLVDVLLKTQGGLSVVTEVAKCGYNKNVVMRASKLLPKLREECSESLDILLLWRSLLTWGYLRSELTDFADYIISNIACSHASIDLCLCDASRKFSRSFELDRCALTCSILQVFISTFDKLSAREKSLIVSSAREAVSVLGHILKSTQRECVCFRRTDAVLSNVAMFCASVVSASTVLESVDLDHSASLSTVLVDLALLSSDSICSSISFYTNDKHVSSPVVGALCRLLLEVSRVTATVNSGGSLIDVVLDLAPLRKRMKSFLDKQSVEFCWRECDLLLERIMICRLALESPGDMDNLYLSCACKILTQLTTGFEAIIEELLVAVISRFTNDDKIRLTFSRTTESIDSETRKRSQHLMKLIGITGLGVRDCLHELPLVPDTSEPLCSTLWFFQPLHALYCSLVVHRSTQQRTIKALSPEQAEDIRHAVVLSTIILNRLYDEHLHSYISLGDVYRAIGELYLLCDPSLYSTENPLHVQLQILMQFLFQRCSDFDLQIAQDFYESLLDCFSESAYSDVVFANFLFLPLFASSRHTFAFWTNERETFLRTVTLNRSECMFDADALINRECEEESSVILSYSRALISGNVSSIRNPFLYDFAVCRLRRAFLSKRTDVLLVKEQFEKQCTDAELLNLVMK